MVNTSSNESSKSLSKAVENKLPSTDTDHFLGNHQEAIIFQAQCEQQKLKVIRVQHTIKQLFQTLHILLSH